MKVLVSYASTLIISLNSPTFMAAINISCPDKEHEILNYHDYAQSLTAPLFCLIRPNSCVAQRLKSGSVRII